MLDAEHFDVIAGFVDLDEGVEELVEAFGGFIGKDDGLGGEAVGGGVLGGAGFAFGRGGSAGEAAVFLRGEDAAER